MILTRSQTGSAGAIQWHQSSGGSRDHSSQRGPFLAERLDQQLGPLLAAELEVEADYLQVRFSSASGIVGGEGRFRPSTRSSSFPIAISA